LALRVWVVVLLTQRLYGINTRLHRLRQPIRQISRLLTSGIVQVKTGNCALHTNILTDKWHAANTTYLIASHAAFYWPEARYTPKKQAKIALKRQFEPVLDACTASTGLQNPVFTRFLIYQSGCSPLEYRGSSYCIYSVQFIQDLVKTCQIRPPHPAPVRQPTHSSQKPSLLPLRF
jgi:hypothetical protein